MLTVCLLGSTGMLGQVISRILKNGGHSLIEVNRSKTTVLPESQHLNFDPLESDMSALGDVISESDVVINLMGVIKHRINEKSVSSIGEAFLVNSLLSRNIIRLAANHGKKLITIGTDCVFNGSKGNYVESSPHDATDVYGLTKSAGENMNSIHILLRASFVGLNDRYHKELMDWVLHHPKGSTVNGFRNHHWNGLTTLHVAKVISGVMGTNAIESGCYHVIPKDAITKADLIGAIARKFGREDLNILAIDDATYVNRVLATEKPELISQIWNLAGYVFPPSIDQMLTEFTNWSLQFGDYEF